MPSESSGASRTKDRADFRTDRASRARCNHQKALQQALKQEKTAGEMFEKDVREKPQKPVQKNRSTAQLPLTAWSPPTLLQLEHTWTYANSVWHVRIWQVACLFPLSRTKLQPYDVRSCSGLLRTGAPLEPFPEDDVFSRIKAPLLGSRFLLSNHIFSKLNNNSNNTSNMQTVKDTSECCPVVTWPVLT